MKTKGYSSKLFAKGDHKDPRFELAQEVVDLKLARRWELPRDIHSMPLTPPELAAAKDDLEKGRTTRRVY